MLILEVLAQQSFALWVTEKGRGGRGDSAPAVPYVFCRPIGNVQNWGVPTIPRGQYPGTSALYIYFFFINHRKKIITGFPKHPLFTPGIAVWPLWLCLNSAPCIVPAPELCMSLSLSVPEHKGHTGPLAPLSLSNYCSLRASVPAPVYFCVFFKD